MYFQTFHVDTCLRLRLRDILILMFGCYRDQEREKLAKFSPIAVSNLNCKNFESNIVFQLVSIAWILSGQDFAFRIAFDLRIAKVLRQLKWVGCFGNMGRSINFGIYNMKRWSLMLNLNHSNNKSVNQLTTKPFLEQFNSIDSDFRVSFKIFLHTLSQKHKQSNPIQTWLTPIQCTAWFWECSS